MMLIDRWIVQAYDTKMPRDEGPCFAFDSEEEANKKMDALNDEGWDVQIYHEHHVLLKTPVTWRSHDGRRTRRTQSFSHGTML
jgi:hypothetical protein